MMQRAQRCSCSVRSLEAFVRDVAGLEIQSRTTSRRIVGFGRAFGTTSTFKTQQYQSHPSQTTTMDGIAFPSHQEADSIPSTANARLDILAPFKSRAQSRLERKARREAARKSEAEEAEQQAAALKKKQRREKKKMEAGKQTIADVEAEETTRTADAGETTSEAEKKNTTRQPKVDKAGKAPEARNTARAAKLAKAGTTGADKKMGDEAGFTKAEREQWQIQKAALEAKFGKAGWQPRKRISPDALAGIRSMHAQQPTIYTTEVLAEHFKVSAEAIRRILKSKWQADEEAAEDRRKRWEKRGARKWKEMVELGIRPPKKWREMGVGKVGKGEKPLWKRGGAQGGGGERWIEHPETDAFVMAGDMAAEEAEPSLGERIV